MGRVVKSFMIKPEWPLQPSTAPIAPHRYTWENDLPDLDSFGLHEWDQMKAAIPYKDGEVVYIDRGGVAVRALIIDAFVRRDEYSGVRRPRYRVMVETAKDTWSKNWEYVFPGFIQRGYLAAGLAPDCEGKL